MSEESFQQFPVEISYMPESMKRSSLAHQTDKIVRKDSQEKAEKSWLERNAESVELVLEDNDSEELGVNLAMKHVAEIVWRLLCNICCEGISKDSLFQLSDTLERNSLGLCVLTLESFQRFPVEISYMPESMKRSSLAHQTDKIVRKDSQEKAEKSWLERNAESVELVLEDNDSEELGVNLAMKHVAEIVWRLLCNICCEGISKDSLFSESFQRFPVEISYMPESMKRSSLAHQTDKIVRKDSQEKAEKSWLERNAESVELVLEDNDSEELGVNLAMKHVAEIVWRLLCNICCEGISKDSLFSESFQRFPVEISYMPESMKRSSLAHQTDKIVRKDSQEKAEKSWLERNAESVELVLEDDDSEELGVKCFHLNKLQKRIPIWWLRQMKWKTKLETGSHQTIGLDLVNASEDDTGRLVSIHNDTLASMSRENHYNRALLAVSSRHRQLLA
ncbi:DEAD-box ATP-dependent RNA helicase 13 [Sesamum angolense]|uniref:DEAD-box ATP-dependent RNA helicase 13 n=1 Tax=Sesamum angolense TaxID=2727404 RepID=A0AAE1T1T0_9LAMI|nr:DEAD-box ATP-dependent RNA helicase 13 [Sesamum angolense]